MIELSLATGIAPQAWLDAGPRAIVTAEQRIEAVAKRAGGSDAPARFDGGRQMSG